LLALPTFAVQTLHAGAIAFSAIAVAEVLPTLVLSGWIGRLVQRRNTLQVMVGADILRVVPVLALTLAAIFTEVPLGSVLLIAAVLGLLTATFDVAMQSLIAAWPDTKTRATLNSGATVGQSAGQILGPPVGGLAIGLLGASTALVIDALTFIASAVLLWAIRPAIPLTTSTSLLTAVDASGKPSTGGFGVLRSIPLVWRLTMAGTALNLGGAGLGAVFILYCYERLDLDVSAVGLLYGAYGTAALIGGLVASRLIAKFGYERVTALSGTVAAISLSLIPFARVGWPMAFLLLYEVLFGLSATVWSVAFTTLRQDVIPVRLLSAVNASLRAVLVASFPVGALLAGALAAWLSMDGATTVLAAIAALSVAGYVRRVAWLDRRLLGRAS
jgi:MFS family permease